MLETITKVNGVLNNFAWGPVMLTLLIGTGIFLTFRTGWVQVRWFGYAMKNTVGSLFKKKSEETGENLSAFQAVCTAMAGTVGTGNIAGVTGAIFVGGPGAVFWMWVSAFFGMCTKYSEIALAMKYRETDEKGAYRGGPMYYIQNGLGKAWKPLAILFAILGGLTSFGIGNIAQTSEIAGALNSLIGLPALASGVLLAVVIAFVVFGGVKRVGQVTSYMVPFMSIFYVIAGLAVIVLRLPEVPAAFATIVKSAFSFEAVGGGVGGYAIMLAMRQGFARGVFSNEAGMGSAPIAHAATNTKEPAELHHRSDRGSVRHLQRRRRSVCLRLQGRCRCGRLQLHPARHPGRHHHSDQPGLLRPVHHPELELLRRALLGLRHQRQ